MMPISRRGFVSGAGALYAASLAPGNFAHADSRPATLLRIVKRSLDVKGRAVLVHTGWDRHWTTDAYFEGHPYLTEAAAAALVERGAVFVGIDSFNIDDTDDLRRPVHTLLGNNIPIGEHLCGLAGLPARGARFFAVPVKVKAFGTFPVRAFAKV